MPFDNPSGVTNVSAITGSFTNLSAQSILYQGTELSELLDRLPKGIIGQGLLAAQNYTPITTEAPIMEMQFNAIAGRQYTIWLENVRGAVTAANDSFRLGLRYTSDGSQPVVASALLEQADVLYPTNAKYISNKFQITVQSTTTNLIRLLLTASSVTGSTLNIANFDDLNMIVEDIGRLVQGTALNRFIVSPPPQKQLYTFDIQPYTSRSYQGNGQLLSAGNGDQYMYQGDIQVDGNRRSWMWFSGADVAKITAAGGYASVNYCRIFLNYAWWYNSGGGSASIGYHSGLNPGNNTEPSGGVANILRANWSGRNVGQWVDLTGNANIMNAINTGYLKGFMLGNTGNSTHNDYGYALGASAALGSKPGFQMSYYK